ncbi:hypothetical protein ASD06_14545 [Angustibacter sp. Root456]|nr:hypothetical protein ASD06_14545 [Angustibacter sp. Root456]
MHHHGDDGHEQSEHPRRERHHPLPHHVVGYWAGDALHDGTPRARQRDVASGPLELVDQVRTRPQLGRHEHDRSTRQAKQGRTPRRATTAAPQRVQHRRADEREGDLDADGGAEQHAGDQGAAPGEHDGAQREGRGQDVDVRADQQQAEQHRVEQPHPRGS